jgi:hypothetical protein
MQIEVIGVHSVVAPEPCHLIELRLRGGDLAEFLGGVTQENQAEPRDNWQVPYAEHFLNEGGTATLNPDQPEAAPITSQARVAFFFHYLETSRPLETPAGRVQLPRPSPRPGRLAFMLYEPPC